MTRHNDSVQRPKRFYADVSTASTDDGVSVRLDGRTPRSPEGRTLTLPTEALAALVAEEWREQGEYVLPDTMPATRLAWTVIDRAASVRAELAADVARFAGSDLLCYFAEAPVELVERQERRWGPVLDWARDALGLEFIRAQGITHREQPATTLARCAALAAETDDFTLTGLAFAAALFGSAVLAFAVQRGELSGAAAFDLSRLDEVFQEEQWGVDAEAAERTSLIAKDAAMLERWFRALGVSESAKRLTKLGGMAPELEAPPRRRLE